MKKYNLVILSIVLTAVMTSCGNSDNSNNSNNTEVVEEVENTVIEEYNYSFEEIGDVDYQVWNHYEDIYSTYKDGVMGYIDLEGNVLCEPKYQWVAYGDGMLTLELMNDDGTSKKYYESLDGTVTIDNVDGMEIAAAEDFKDGYAIVRLFDENGDFQQYDKVIDKQGNIVLETDRLVTSYRRDEDGNFILTNGMDIFEVYKKDLTPMTKKEIKSNEELDGDYVSYKDGVYIIADMAAYTALYDNEKEKVISDYNIGFGPEKVGNNYLVAIAETPQTLPVYYIVNEQFEKIATIDFEFNYSVMPRVIGDKIILMYRDEPVRILDENGELYKETDYYTIYQNKYGTIYCAKDGGVGLLDKDFNEIIAPEYDYITEIYNGVGLAQTGTMLYKVTATSIE